MKEAAQNIDLIIIMSNERGSSEHGFNYSLWAGNSSTIVIANKDLTLRRLMSYIYIYIYIYMEHPFLMFLDHTQRRGTVGRTPLDE